eukprot:199592-Pleurochrysis_carterae.AAC.3
MQHVSLSRRGPDEKRMDGGVAAPVYSGPYRNSIKRNDADSNAQDLDFAPFPSNDWSSTRVHHSATKG